MDLQVAAEGVNPCHFDFEVVIERADPRRSEIFL